MVLLCYWTEFKIHESLDLKGVLCYEAHRVNYAYFSSLCLHSLYSKKQTIQIKLLGLCKHAVSMHGCNCYTEQSSATGLVVVMKTALFDLADFLCINCNFLTTFPGKFHGKLHSTTEHLFAFLIFCVATEVEACDPKNSYIFSKYKIAFSKHISQAWK